MFDGDAELKKDPGIPNLFPFKEQLLQKMKNQKERLDGEKERQRLQRRRENTKKRSLQGLQNDAQKRTREFEKRDKLAAEIKAAVNECGPESDKSLRAYYREFRKVLESSDVVLEVLDARDPLGCRCVAAEEAILSAGVNKRLVLILNKIGEIFCWSRSGSTDCSCSLAQQIHISSTHYDVFPGCVPVSYCQPTSTCLNPV